MESTAESLARIAGSLNLNACERGEGRMDGRPIRCLATDEHGLTRTIRIPGGNAGETERASVLGEGSAKTLRIVFALCCYPCKSVFIRG